MSHQSNYIDLLSQHLLRLDFVLARTLQPYFDHQHQTIWLKLYQPNHASSIVRDSFWESACEESIAKRPLNPNSQRKARAWLFPSSWRQPMYSIAIPKIVARAAQCLSVYMALQKLIPTLPPFLHLHTHTRFHPWFRDPGVPDVPGSWARKKFPSSSTPRVLRGLDSEIQPNLRSKQTHPPGIRAGLSEWNVLIAPQPCAVLHFEGVTALSDQCGKHRKKQNKKAKTKAHPQAPFRTAWDLRCSISTTRIPLAGARERFWEEAIPLAVGTHNLYSLRSAAAGSFGQLLRPQTTHKKKAARESKSFRRNLATIYAIPDGSRWVRADVDQPWPWERDQ